MTPRQVDELTDDEYFAMCRYIDRDVREQKRAARRAGRKR